MSWLATVFAKKTPAKIESEKITANQNNVVETSLTCSAPLKITDKKHSLLTLKRFVPLRNLSDHQIELVPYTTQMFAANAVIFIQGEPSDTIYYLLQGSVKIQPSSESHYIICSDDTRAHLPLNTGKICGATAIAIDRVILLAISGEINQLWAEQSREKISCVEIIDIELPKELNDQRFFESFSRAYRENQLSLPSLPHVAIKLKEAMAHNVGVNQAVEIIHLDPAIVTKLIQIANSPVYSPITPITNCHDAVTRLGLEASRSLVMGISLKQMFQCKDKQLMKGMQSLWKRSLYVSSLCFVLASEADSINPEDALLAGLINDIGIIPLLHFAEQHPDEYPEFKDIENAMPYLRSPVGTLVLHTLGFSEELTAIPHHAEDWFYDSGGSLTLTDIVILAKLHSYISRGKKNKDLPYINSIPAYAKLKQGKLSPDFSLQILHKAQKRISSAMRMLA